MDDLFDNTNERKPPFDIPNKKGYLFEWSKDKNGFDIEVPHGKLFYSEYYFDKEISDRSIGYFLKNNNNNWQTANWRSLDKERLSDIDFINVVWNHDKIKKYGKEFYLPRYSAWYGDSDKPYTYSGLTLQPEKWNDGLLYIKNHIEKISSVKFNSVLMNWYRDGDDHINWHTDAEKELGKNPVIGSVNFGETRDFILRMRDDKSSKITIPLKHGTFLLMSGELQHYWQHSVPKRKNVKGSRLNLTFREIK